MEDGEWRMEECDGGDCFQIARGRWAVGGLSQMGRHPPALRKGTGMGLAGGAVDQARRPLKQRRAGLVLAKDLSVWQD
jgi:hypothetical protein